MKKKKSLYYSTIYRRRNVLADFLLGIFYDLSSWPRLCLEVFLRRDMGRRYYSLATTITIVNLLLFVPLGRSLFMSILMRHSSYLTTSMGWEDWTWYVFTAAFLFFSILRYREIKLAPSTFDFSRFSLSSGRIHDFFYSIKLFNKKATPRLIEILYEPGACFLVGLFIALFAQAVGYLIIVCSIFYSLSYMAAYRRGDNYVLDKIDEKIAAESEFESFVEDKDIRGFLYRGYKPEAREDREKLMDSLSALDDMEFEVA